MIEGIKPYKKIPYMIELTESVPIESTIAWLNEYWAAS